MPISTIFLDDGGVMNDNTRRAAEWERLVGEFLAHRLGGAPEAWGEANGVVFERQWRRFEDWQRQRLAVGEYGDFFGSMPERDRWLREMCEHVGIRAPDRDGCVALAIETERYVLPRVRAAYPGAVEAVRELHARGYTLCTASSGSSRELHGHLTGMGVRELFTPRLYGPDLVQANKESARFYERIFADAGVRPEEALVVDDAPAALERAVSAGGATALVSAERAADAPAQIVIASLAELPAALERL